MLKELVKLRHQLHKYPEVSNKEHKTSKRIYDFIKKLNPDEVIHLGQTGLAFVFVGQRKGKTIMFRAELDALPITETSGLPYSSKNKNIAHLCGHDGHMAILSGLSKKIAQNRPNKGRVVILFQPAEEVEQGARDMVNHPLFKSIQPDYIFALHNIPKVEKNTIVIKNGSFAAASKGMTIELKGETSHAGEPEKGINPAVTISEIIRQLKALINDKNSFKDFTLLTFIYIRMGEISFGTSAGEAKLGITLRAYENEDMQTLTQKSKEIIKNICINEKIKYYISYDEVFPATVNNEVCVDLIEKAAKTNNYKLCYTEKPFKWSEDFGYYTEKYKGGFFGLGSGINQPPLHNPKFDFPDEIIETGINVFFNIYKNTNLQ